MFFSTHRPKFYHFIYGCLSGKFKNGTSSLVEVPCISHSLLLLLIQAYLITVESSAKIGLLGTRWIYSLYCINLFTKINMNYPCQTYDLKPYNYMQDKRKLKELHGLELYRSTRQPLLLLKIPITVLICSHLKNLAISIPES